MICYASKYILYLLQYEEGNENFAFANGDLVDSKSFSMIIDTCPN